MPHDRAAHLRTVCCMAAAVSAVAEGPDAVPTASVVSIVAAIAAATTHAGQVWQQLLE